MANETILIVDDDDLIVEVMQAHLERGGYHSESVYSGEAAVEFVRANAPDLILMDVSMRGIDGLETTRIIKADPAVAFIPVLLVTGFQEARDIQRAIEAGVDDILFKPVNNTLMLLRIKSLIRIKKLHDQLNG
ncbi:MAG: response regulator [Chloroflexota bacterium]